MKFLKFFILSVLFYQSISAHHYSSESSEECSEEHHHHHVVPGTNNIVWMTRHSIPNVLPSRPASSVQSVLNAVWNPIAMLRPPIISRARPQPVMMPPRVVPIVVDPRSVVRPINIFNPASINLLSTLLRL
jgi:hypothetical protein